MGLLGASVTMALSRSAANIKTIGYSHRASTRRKARLLGVADKIVENIDQCVEQADLVILATPISVFQSLFKQIAPLLKAGAIVTDVGSTKTFPHRWAEKALPKNVYYVGSHPITGSEKRGLEFARDNLFLGTRCILTKKKNTNPAAVRTLKKFWSQLGCFINQMTPAAHDRIFGKVSHLPHVTAAALVNASNAEQMTFAGKGFIDTSRLASGPANIWADILVTNSANVTRGLDAMIKELTKFQNAIGNKDQKKIEKLLNQARTKRAALIDYKMKKNELL